MTGADRCGDTIRAQRTRLRPPCHVELSRDISYCSRAKRGPEGNSKRFLHPFDSAQGKTFGRNDKTTVLSTARRELVMSGEVDTGLTIAP